MNWFEVISVVFAAIGFVYIFWYAFLFPTPTEGKEKNEPPEMPPEWEKTPREIKLKIVKMNGATLKACYYDSCIDQYYAYHDFVSWYANGESSYYHKVLQNGDVFGIKRSEISHFEIYESRRPDSEQLEKNN